INRERVGLQSAASCTPQRRPGKRRPPYITCTPPSVGSTQRVGHQSAPSRTPQRRPEKRRPPYVTRTPTVGWSTQRVGHRTEASAHRNGGRENADRPTARAHRIGGEKTPSHATQAKKGRLAPAQPLQRPLTTVSATPRRPWPGASRTAVPARTAGHGATP